MLNYGFLNKIYEIGRSVANVFKTTRKFRHSYFQFSVAENASDCMSLGRLGKALTHSLSLGKCCFNGALVRRNV